jgi:hypothetical protein
MKICKLALAVAGATVLLGALVSSASAGRLSASTQSIRATWSRMDFTGIFGTTECEVTLSGSLHSRTIAKVVGSLIGYINRAEVRSPCIRGEATILRETLPWHVQYDGFTGTLPNITAIRTRIVLAGFRIRVFESSCLARTSSTQPATGTFNRETGTGRISSVTVGGRIRTGAECAGAEGTLSGTSHAVDPLTITLI